MYVGITYKHDQMKAHNMRSYNLHRLISKTTYELKIEILCFFIDSYNQISLIIKSGHNLHMAW